MFEYIAEDTMVTQSLQSNKLSKEERGRLEQIRDAIEVDLRLALGLHDHRIATGLLGFNRREIAERLEKRKEQNALRHQTEEVRNAYKDLKREWELCGEEGHIDCWGSDGIQYCLEKVEGAAKKRRCVEAKTTENV